MALIASKNKRVKSDLTIERIDDAKNVIFTAQLPSKKSAIDLLIYVYRHEFKKLGGYIVNMEKRRRNKISERIRTLWTLVPNCNKSLALLADYLDTKDASSKTWSKHALGQIVSRIRLSHSKKCSIGVLSSLDVFFLFPLLTAPSEHPRVYRCNARRAVALNAGSKSSSALAFFLPLERVVTALNFLQMGKYSFQDKWEAVTIPRGTLRQHLSTKDSMKPVESVFKIKQSTATTFDWIIITSPKAEIEKEMDIENMDDETEFPEHKEEHGLGLHTVDIVMEENAHGDDVNQSNEKDEDASEAGNELVGVVSDENLLELLELAMSSNTAETVKRARELMELGVYLIVLMSQMATLIMDIIAGTYQVIEASADSLFDGRSSVASSQAAEIGLDILAQTIQDDLDNITRFLILAREPIIPGIDKPHKTSIVFTLEEGPRVLFNALAVFALRDINLSKVSNQD
uniref:Prephenate dehydratase domain-containing protein n=1 Tax=Lactuca sativa TaxID=4236 RepID=A0A9R1XQC2_LACSA|nr:hypothetical protein LSAT_V11C300152530 [Lactuca sativa]